MANQKTINVRIKVRLDFSGFEVGAATLKMAKWLLPLAVIIIRAVVHSHGG